MPDRRHDIEERVRRRAARVLRQARHRLNWTQSRLGQEMLRIARAKGQAVANPGSLTSMISKWENARQVPDRYNRAILCAALQIDEADLGLPDEDDDLW